MAPEATPATPVPPSTRGYAADRHSYLIRLRRIEGQVRGVQKMAADDHVRHCVLEAARDSGEAGQARMDEVAAAIRQVIRL